MKERIEKIRNLNKRWMESNLYPPANEENITRFEKENGINIPKSYKDFLLLTNGAEIFGGDAYFYGVCGEIGHYINYDITEGQIPKQLLILGFYNDDHVCYDFHDDVFVFYNDEGYENIKEDCVTFSDFSEVLDYIIDIAEN
ncbi:MAG: SMI1/KNR4 family protein [Oscillospiraceae bacterium]|nr:SMI1/KNR4 family protein [Oscillospiraceae bacterium]